MASIRAGLSAGVRVLEKDISDHVSNQVSTVCMLIGNSIKGPANKIKVVNTEKEFVELYGEPTSDTAATFFAASGYFARGGQLVYTRVVDRPTAIVSAIGFDINSDNEPDGSLPLVANLDPYIYNNDLSDYAETSDDTIVTQEDVDAFYNTDNSSTQAFYTRHTFNRAYPRERNTEYEYGDIVHDGWVEATEVGDVEHFSGDSINFPNGYVYQCVKAGLTSYAWNSEAQKTDAVANGTGNSADEVITWDEDIGDTTTEGETIWQRVEWVEETGIGGIRYKHGTTITPEYYDPDDTSTFDYNVTINDEAKAEDLVIAGIGPGNAYDEYYIALLSFADAEKLKKYSFSVNVPRETLASDSYVPNEFVSWSSNGETNIKHNLSTVTYGEYVNTFDFLNNLPADLPKTPEEFGLFVLVRDTVSNSWGTAEYWRLSTNPNGFDENGQNIYVDEKLNSASKLVRGTLATVAQNSTVTTTLPIALNGGTVGELANFYETVDRNGVYVSMAGEVIFAADMYRESDIDIDVIIEGDKPLALKKEMAQLAEDLNGEAIAVLDVPFEKADVNSIVEWTQDELLLSSSYAALYHNRGWIYDKYSGTYRWVAPSGAVAGIYTLTDKNDYPWFAPAGINRGLLPEWLNIRENFRIDKRNTLYANRVNPIAIINSAIAVYGQKTLLDKVSYLDRVNVRRLLAYLKRRSRRLAEQFVFEFNDEFTRSQMSGIFNQFLQDVLNKRGLEEFLVVCDETNNDATVRENNELYVDLYVKPTAVAEFIYLRFFVTRPGIDLQELVTRNLP